MDDHHGIAWKTCTRVRWALIVSLIASSAVATRGAFVAYVCHVVRLFPLQGCISIRISVTPSKMGDGLLAALKCSNSTFIRIHMFMRWMSTT
jgi:hypothetical protein